jgi:aspartyl-tRNA(Asn)/glutamyl-tRNA(Gln) amidotransferase subunit A
VAEPPSGIRLAVKDLFDTAGVRTTYGSAIFGEHVPERTAAAVTRLEDAGYATAGKANLHEFAYGVTSENPHYGTVVNPVAPGRTSGGSSGGSAAALAAGLADAALGSDSAGSIRIPAACCGVVGFKPSYGLVPMDGCFPLAPSFDHAGPMAVAVEGCSAMMDALVPGFAREAATLEDVAVGYAWLELADPLVAERVRGAVGLFPRAQEVELEVPDRRDWGALFRREALESHQGLFPERAEDYGDDVRQSLAEAAELSDGDVEASRRARDRYRERFANALAAVDLLVTPTLPCVAPATGAGDRTTLTKFTSLYNLVGAPAVALPCGAAEDGLPASVQLGAAAGADALVLAVATALERALSLE